MTAVTGDLGIAVIGATGRMGRLVQDVVEHEDGMRVAAAVHLGVPLETAAGADLIIDFTVLDVSRKVVDFALEHRIPVIVGTSGWTRELIAARAPGPADGTLVVVPNFSVASAVATRLAEIAAPFFAAAEVIEAHHAGKVDSPSGTAVATAEAIAGAHRTPLVPPHPDQPARGQTVEGVPVHSLRLPGVVARQQVIFGGVGETLAIEHDTSADDSYRAGLVRTIHYALEHPGTTIGLGAVLGID